MCENIIQLFAKLRKKMTSITEISLAAKDWQIKGTKQLNGMSKDINFINEKFEEFERDLKKKKKRLNF